MGAKTGGKECWSFLVSFLGVTDYTSMKIDHFSDGCLFSETVFYL